jgi:hypothetical protein
MIKYYIMFKIIASLSYNNALSRVCECRRFNHMWKALAYDLIISSTREVWVHKTSLTQPCILKCLYQARRVGGHVFCVLEVSILPQSFYDYVIGLFRNCSDSAVFRVLRFIISVLLSCLQLVYSINHVCSSVICQVSFIKSCVRRWICKRR